MESAAATGVTAPVARSVMETAEAFELVQESVVLCPALIVVALAPSESAEASGFTVTLASAVTLPTALVTVRRYVRVESGETDIEPLTGTPVTAPLARSVMVADEPLELDHESVEEEPSQIGEVAVNELIAGAGV